MTTIHTTCNKRQDTKHPNYDESKVNQSVKRFQRNGTYNNLVHPSLSSYNHSSSYIITSLPGLPDTRQQVRHFPAAAQPSPHPSPSSNSRLAPLKQILRRIPHRIPIEQPVIRMPSTPRITAARTARAPSSCILNTIPSSRLHRNGRGPRRTSHRRLSCLLNVRGRHGHGRL